MSGASVSDLDVGPMLPATQTFRGALSAAARAIRAPARAISCAWASSPYSFWEIRFALKVLVSMISVPAAM